MSMNWEVAEKRGNDLFLRICVYPDLCGQPGEVHEDATFGLGYSDNETTPATPRAVANRQEAIIEMAKVEFADAIRAKYTSPPGIPLSFQDQAV